jgi:hypothetical protein
MDGAASLGIGALVVGTPAVVGTAAVEDVVVADVADVEAVELYRFVMAEPPNFTTTSMQLRDRHNFRRRSVSMVGISVRRRSSEVRVANRMARRQQRFGCRVRLKHAQKGNWMSDSAKIESKIGILVKFCV